MDEKILPAGNKAMIMSDRELLELAAKAAGITLMPMDVSNVEHPGDDRFIGYMADPDQWPRGWFNPLVDDGDAFRLMVDLNLDLTFDIIEGEVFVCEPFGDYWSECLGDNPRAATRRVIVRAAAAIGESL